MTSWPFSDRAHDGIEIRTGYQYDTYTGSVEALIAAGLIERSQLPPQAGRMPGNAAFFPDGTPVPPHGTGMPREAGYRWIEVFRDGRASVRTYLSKEEQWVRQRDAPLSEYASESWENYEGNREQLVAHGLPAEWMDETRKKEGKRWTKRTIREPGRKIEIWFTPYDRYRIEVRKDAPPKPTPASSGREAELQREAAASGMTVDELVRWKAAIHADSEAEFREQACTYLEGLEESVILSLQDMGAGYSFDLQTLMRIRAQFSSMRSVLKQGPVAFDAELRRQRVDQAFKAVGLVQPETNRPALRLVSG